MNRRRAENRRQLSLVWVVILAGLLALAGCEGAGSNASVNPKTSANAELQRARTDLSASVKDLTADLAGGVLGGPVGMVVARVLRSDVRASVDNLAALR